MMERAEPTTPVEVSGIVDMDTPIKNPIESEPKSLVVPFRYGSADSFELRYSLRSWDKFSPELVHDAYLIGDDRPSWFFGINISHKQEQRLPGVCNVLAKLKKACEDPRITEDFIYTNDDCYLVAPFKSGPFWMRNGPLREGGIHHKGFNLTFDELDRRGIKKPYLDCELHYPVIYNKAKCLKLLNEIDIRLPYSFRTLYFNLLGVQLAPEADHKRFSWILPKPGEFCVSSNDSTVGQQLFKDWATKTFKEKSRWEA